MTQAVAVVRAALDASSVGATTDFTVSGFGTPTAAIVILSYANTTNNPEDGAHLSLGAWDGTNQWCCAANSADNTADTSTLRISSTSTIAKLSTVSWAASAITDGIRLTHSGSTTTSRYATVILLKGVTAKAFSLAIPTTTATTGSLGFAPAAAFFGCVGSGTTATNTSHALLSLGFAASDGTNLGLLFGEANAVSVGQPGQYLATNAAMGQVYSDALSWRAGVTTWGSDTLSVTANTSTSGDYVFGLALDSAISFDAGTFTTLTSTGTDSITTSVDPDAVLTVLSTVSALDTLKTNSEANGIAVGIADSSQNYSHTFYVEDAATTTNTGSVASASTAIDLDSSASGSRTDLVTGTITPGTAKFDIVYSSVDATARKGWYVAFGPATGGGGLDITGTLATATASGYTAGVDRQLGVTASLATATASGYDASLSSDLSITATLATVTASGYAAGVDRQLGVTASLATATASGYDAGISTGLQISAALAEATGSGYFAAVNLQLGVTATPATATASGYTASLSSVSFTQEELDYLLAYMQSHLTFSVRNIKRWTGTEWV